MEVPAASSRKTQRLWKAMWYYRCTEYNTDWVTSKVILLRLNRTKAQKNWDEEMRKWELSLSNIKRFYVMSLTGTWFQVWSHFQWAPAIWLGIVISAKNAIITFHWKPRLDMNDTMENLYWLLRYGNETCKWVGEIMHHHQALVSCMIRDRGSITSRELR